jgi:hypothetical protein
MNCGNPVFTHLPDRGMRCEKGKGPHPRGGAARFRSVLLFPSFFPASFARQCFLHALFLAGFQIKGVALDLLNDVFLLHFTLKTPQCILKGLALLQSYFCQRNYTPKLVQWDCIVIARFCAQVKDYVGRMGYIYGLSEPGGDSRTAIVRQCKAQQPPIFPGNFSVSFW